MSPYHNINSIIESVKYTLKENPTSDLGDIMHEIVDIEVSYNQLNYNKHIIQDYFDMDVIDVLIEYQKEYGDIEPIKTEQDKYSLYARLAYFLIMKQLREKYDEEEEELDDEEEEESDDEEEEESDAKEEE